MSKQPMAASLRNATIDANDDVPSVEPRQSESLGPPARAGKVALTLRIDADLHLDLKMNAFKRDTSIQELILESLKRNGYQSARPSRR